MGICEYNFEIINKEKKFYFRCNKTNKEGSKFQICENGFILNNNGLCMDINNWVEKDENGNWKKCKINENCYYCLKMILAALKLILMIVLNLEIL